ncbi:hypothetical protein [Vibrio diazotrophicus]|uniref:hypothetical protein n=1 Tax=Vibrio diazotrophicus TaxID=685 RepID=UPI00142DBD60|nr:hypothetical protein [Vibrio diazotrophicus]NIY91891.1 hypothetical protein [Vibrio diazotrophicus]
MREITGTQAMSLGYNLFGQVYSIGLFLDDKVAFLSRYASSVGAVLSFALAELI